MSQVQQEKDQKEQQTQSGQITRRGPIGVRQFRRAMISIEPVDEDELCERYAG